MEEERMLKWFDFSHLSGEARSMSSDFCHLAKLLCSRSESGPERTVALRKLLEAKDAAVRSVIAPGG